MIFIRNRRCWITNFYSPQHRTELMFLVKNSFTPYQIRSFELMLQWGIPFLPSLFSIDLTNIFWVLAMCQGFPRWLSGKESACKAGDTHLIPGWGRSPGGGNGKSLQYSYLENSMDIGAWWAIKSMGSVRVKHSNWAHTHARLRATHGARLWGYNSETEM